MSKVTLKQTSVLGGISPTYYEGAPGTYLAGIGIDPDLSAGSGSGRVRISANIFPTAYEKFSSTNVNDYPIAIITTPKTELIYAVLANGRLISYSNTFGSETLIGTVSGNAAYGAWYYNNYIYITTGTDISRYGPLAGGAAALTDGVWTGATLGTLTALTSTTYPTYRALPIPQHWGFVHAYDGAAYFFDFKNGQGLIHKIKTTLSGTEGTGNDGSAYNVLDLPFGYYPTAGCSYGTDIAILAIRTTSTVLRQGNAALFLWDTVSDSPYRVIELPDVYATAIANVNGQTYIWSGSANGFRISVFNGGGNVQQVAFFEDGVTPLAGGVSAFGDKVAWGSYTSYPNTYAVAYSFNSKDSRLPAAIHCPAKATSSGSTPFVTCLAYLQQQSGQTPRLVMGWGDGSAKGIDYLGTNTNFNSNTPYWRSQMFQIGKKWKMTRMQIPLSTTTSSGVREILPRIVVDDEGTTYTLNGKDAVSSLVYKRPELTAQGKRNFFISLEWSGTATLPVELPIEIDIEVFDDQPSE